MDMLKKVESYIKIHRLLKIHDTILVATSGGSDSIALARILVQLKYKIHLAHVNYHLRGDESNKDLAFVKALADEIDVPFHSTSIHLENQKKSIQLLARETRYQWFEKIRKEQKLNKIATAHHENDQIETILYRWLGRGTGIKGLSGIAPQNGMLIRPLLKLTKQEITEYANQYNWGYRQDKSNLNNDYDRNWIRNELLPLILKRFPNANQHILHNSSLLKEAFDIQYQYLQTKAIKKLKFKKEEIHFPINYLRKCGFDRTLIWHYAENTHFTSKQINQILNLYDAANSKRVSSSTHQFFKYQNWLILTPLKIKTEPTIIVLEKEGSYQTPLGQLTIKTANITQDKQYTEQSTNMKIYVDALQLKFPITLRRWKQGDYFYPLGMRKKKKLARLLIDKKKSFSEKESVWVIESSSRIVWVMGIHMDDRFKLTSSSSKAFMLEIKGE